MTRKYIQLSFALALSVVCMGCADNLDITKGETIVKNNCKVCHAQGINGAPIIGNRKMWQPRLAKGEQALVENAISGFGLMPPKGGKDHLSDDEIGLAVGYFLAQLDK